MAQNGVRYPAPWSSAATLGASTGRATPFIHTPWVCGIWPVTIVARFGMHTTWLAGARS